jgi:putative transposase
VTIHLAGAIPEEGQDRIREIAARLDKLARQDQGGRLGLHRKVFAEMEAWLDHAEQALHLRHPEIAEMVMEAIAFRQQRQWRIFEFVLMPSHVHLFFESFSEVTQASQARQPVPLGSGDLPCSVIRGEPWDLKRIIEQFKRWTGHQAGKLLNLESSQFWQDEWFDHWSRSPEEDEKIVHYIRHNPEKANLVQRYGDWPFGSWSPRWLHLSSKPPP